MKGLLLIGALSTAVLATPWLVTDYVVVTGTFVNSAYYKTSTYREYISNYAHSALTVPASTVTYYSPESSTPLYSEIVPTVSPIPATRTTTDIDHNVFGLETYTYAYVEVPAGIGKPLVTSQRGDVRPAHTKLRVTYLHCRTSQTEVINFRAPSPLVLPLTPTATVTTTVTIAAEAFDTQTLVYVAPTAIASRYLYEAILDNSREMSNNCSDYQLASVVTWPNTTCRFDNTSDPHDVPPPGFRCDEIDPCCDECQFYQAVEDDYYASYYNCSSGYRYLASKQPRHGSQASLTSSLSSWALSCAALSTSLLSLLL